MLATAAFLFVAAVTDLSIRNDLIAAAKANDLPLFDDAIQRAQDYIDTMPVGARRNAFRREILIAGDTSRVWHFEVKSGSLYYDDESLPFYYDRLASEYPKYPKFIREYRIVDNTGLPHYPTRETRGFLLRLLENNRGKSP
ncbi:MAG TPA: hypothetical protein VJ853_01015 [Thermoanaerobaculia bacterium]|nr:hypothetical protein [Thermoanaerobaculia bacterium]